MKDWIELISNTVYFNGLLFFIFFLWNCILTFWLIIAFRTLPSKKRLRIVEAERAYAQFEQAHAAGRYDSIIAETDSEYAEGRALSQIY